MRSSIICYVVIMMLIIAAATGIGRLFQYVRFPETNIVIVYILSPSRNIEAPYYIKAQGKTPIDITLASDTTGFVACYIGLFIIGSLLTTVTPERTLTEAMFEFASALGTVGLSIGFTTPATNAATLIVEMFGMILGRLETFIVFIGTFCGFAMIKERFWKK